ncbi:MAG: hypothetical protein EA403_10740, partial [Spirochaetaceae bacterium]
MKLRIGSVPLFVSVCFLVLAVLAVLSFTVVDGPASFSDPALDAAVRAALERPDRPIRNSDLSLVHHLNASGRGIQSLEGLERLTSLVTLDLSGNQIRDLSPLAGLVRLSELNLSANPITDLGEANLHSLSRLPLRVLRLRNNRRVESDGSEVQLTDITALSALPGLERLDLRGNGVQNLEPLRALTRLHTLDLRDNRVDTIAPLEALTALQSLNLRGNAVHDITTLAALPQLTYLNLHSNPGISSLAPLTGLTDLETLILRNVPVGNQLDSLSALTGLSRLNLRNTGFTDYPALSAFMAAGALQDSPGNGIRAEVDVRDNPPHGQPSVVRQLAPYWRNVAYRRPATLPEAPVPAPRFSHAGGFFTQPFALTLSAPDGYRIHYTTDGTPPDPTENPERTRYTGTPITIRDRSSDPNTLSMIHPLYPDRGWTPPEQPMVRATTIRAVAVDPDTGSVSDTVTHTYFVDPQGAERYGVPVIALSTDPEGFFSHDTGIYVAGRAFEDTQSFWRQLNPRASWHYRPANFHQRGRTEVSIGGTQVSRFGVDGVAIPVPDHEFPDDFTYLRTTPQVTLSGTGSYDGIWYRLRDPTGDLLAFQAPYQRETMPDTAVASNNWERPVHLEYFNQDGSLIVSQGLGIRVHGGASRAAPQKSLRLYARSAYDKQRFFDHSVYPDDPQDRFKRLLLRRTTGQSGLADVVGQYLVRELNPHMEIQRSTPVIVTLNGEFWGWYNLRDRYDRWHFALRYGVDPDDIAIAQGFDTLRAGTPADLQRYEALRQLIFHRNPADAATYRAISDMLDIDNFTDWIIAGIYLNYQDWGSKHTQLWRYTGAGAPNGADHLDGKWRMTAIDMDGAFGRGGVGPEVNYLQTIATWPTYFLSPLLRNAHYRDRFLSRFADAINTVFAPDHAVAVLDRFADQVPRSLVEDTINRWGHLPDTSHWEQHLERKRDFLLRRPTYMHQHLVDFFQLPGTASLTIAPFSGGTIRINTVTLPSA